MRQRFALSGRSLENRQGVDPSLIEISDLAIQITLVDFCHGPTAGMRTVEVQRQLYNEGKSLAESMGGIWRTSSW